MFGFTFDNAVIRRYVSLFGTLFNEVYIERRDPDTNDLVKLIRVPIAYGPRDKSIARAEGDPELNRPWSSITPYMMFRIHSFYYDADRHLNKVHRIPGIYASNKNIATNVYQPVPYTFNFELDIVVKNMLDGTKIIEQIVPWFSPDWTTTIKVIDNPEILLDVPVILNPISMEDTWQGSFEDSRIISFTLSFKLLGYLYGPVRKDKIIKVSKINTGILGSNTYDMTVTVTPGLTANGEPTSNSAESVSYSDIDWDDDYGFITEVED